MNKVIGIIKYYDSNEVLEYFDEKSFLLDIQDTLYDYGIIGWSYRVIDNDVLDNKVSNLISQDFGFEVL